MLLTYLGLYSPLSLLTFKMKVIIDYIPAVIPESENRTSPVTNEETKPKWFVQALQGPEHRTPCLMPNEGFCAIVVCGESLDSGSSVDLSS